MRDITFLKKTLNQAAFIDFSHNKTFEWRLRLVEWRYAQAALLGTALTMLTSKFQLWNRPRPKRQLALLSCTTNYTNKVFHRDEWKWMMPTATCNDFYSEHISR